MWRIVHAEVKVVNFKPIKTKKIYEEIVEQIRELITAKKLNPGDKLLSERELAELLKVSRASVREAFSALEIMGLLEIKPGEGTFIRQTSVDSIIQPLALVLMMEHDSIFELLEMRMILEVESAALAAVRKTPDELQEMEEALAQMEKHVDEKNLGAKADIKFHYAVANATHNRLLLRLMNTISDSIEHSVQVNRQKLYESPETPKRLVQEHQAIYQAIKSGDEKQAREAMYKHLDGVVAQLSKAIE